MPPWLEKSRYKKLWTSENSNRVEGGRWGRGDTAGVISELRVGHWGEVAEGQGRRSSEE